MKLYQKAALVIAHEGFSGLSRRTFRKLRLSKRDAVPQPQERMDYPFLVRQFTENVRNMGLGDVRKFLWYHTIDLGNGLVTPGQYDFRSKMSLFDIPRDMKGMRVLDVGSATGFFSFECERRGAQVTSVELPSITDWDMPLGEDRESTVQALMSYHGVSTVEDLDHHHLHGPFEFCHKVLRSKVKRVHATIYDLNADNLGSESFDLVFAGSLLVHLFSPLKALSVLVPFVREKLVISQPIPDFMEDRNRPLMYYLGGDKRGGDGRSWWYANFSCLEQMLKRLGFVDVGVVGHDRGICRPEEHPQGYVYDLTIIHASK